MSYRKKYIEEFVWGTWLFWLNTLLSMSLFVAFFKLFFVLFVAFFKWRTCWIAAIKIHDIAIGVNMCDDIMSKRLKIWKPYAI